MSSRRRLPLFLFRPVAVEIIVAIVVVDVSALVVESEATSAEVAEGAVSAMISVTIDVIMSLLYSRYSVDDIVL